MEVQGYSHESAKPELWETIPSANRCPGICGGTYVILLTKQAYRGSDSTRRLPVLSLIWQRYYCLRFDHCWPCLRPTQSLWMLLQPLWQILRPSYALLPLLWSQVPPSLRVCLLSSILKVSFMNCEYTQLWYINILLIMVAWFYTVTPGSISEWTCDFQPSLD